MVEVDLASKGVGPFIFRGMFISFRTAVATRASMITPKALFGAPGLCFEEFVDRTTRWDFAAG